MKKYWLLIILALIIGFIGGLIANDFFPEDLISRPRKLLVSKFTENPEDILHKYLEASSQRRDKEAYQYFSDKDKKNLSLEDFLLRRSKLYEYSNSKISTGRITRKIKETSTTNGTSIINVEVTHPDFSAIHKALWDKAYKKWREEKGELDDVYFDMFVEKYKRDEDIPMKTDTQEFKLVKEKDGWRIFADFETTEKIAELKKQAEQLEGEKKLYAAKEKYQEILELDSKSYVASTKLVELDKEIGSFKEKQAYINKVKIRNLHVGKSVLDRPGIFGEVKNLGNRTLTEVEITIYFLDKKGKPIFEKKYHPVLVPKWAIGEKPLKPNYSTKFGCKADEVPSDWAKKVRVKVTNIEFEK